MEAALILAVNQGMPALMPSHVLGTYTHAPVCRICMPSCPPFPLLRFTQDVAAELKRLCPGGLDVVYEGVGGDLQKVMLSNLGPKGRLLQVRYGSSTMV